MRYFIHIAMSMISASLAISEAKAQSPDQSNNSPVIVFIHGRGQGEKSLEEVQTRFYSAFQKSQQLHFGSEILPQTAMRFVWYSDAIDPESTAMPEAETCRFAGNVQVEASFKRDLRRSLITIGQRLGLNDVALQSFAGDTHKYLTSPAVRCEADARVAQELFSPSVAGRPIIVVAHSMGGIVAFSALDRLSSAVGITARPKISHLVTIGTQVGVTEILQGLQGGLVKVPVPVPNLIEEWANFQNEGDLLAFGTKEQFKATDLKRVPEDYPVKTSGDPHAVESYLGNVDVIVAITKAWCSAFKSDAPKECALPARTNKTSAIEPLLVDDVRGAVAALSHFFDVSQPSLSISNSHSTSISRVGDNFALTINPAELRRYQADAGAVNFDAVLLFFLAHEIAHIAQAKRLNDRNGESSVVRECEADLWAGTALVNVRPMTGDPALELRKVTGAIVAAAESGTAFRLGFHNSSVVSHPDAIQRAFCAARGMSAGMNMLRFRQILFSGGEGRLSDASEVWNVDTEELGPNDDPWQWSLRNSKRITVGSITAATTHFDVMGNEEMMRLAQAAENGPSSLLSAGVLVKPSPLSECNYFRQPSIAAARCSVSVMPSEKLALESFEATIGMLRRVLLSRGWNSVPIKRMGTEHVAIFSQGSAKSTARVDLTQGKVTVDFEVSH